MITEAMYKAMVERRFATQNEQRYHTKRTSVVQAQTIHRMLEEGVDRQTIAEAVGVPRHAVDYQASKIRKVRAAR